MAPEQVRQLQAWLSQPEAKLLAEHIQMLETAALRTAAECFVAAQDNDLQMGDAKAAAEEVLRYRRFLSLLRGATRGVQDDETTPYRYVR